MNINVWLTAHPRNCTHGAPMGAGYGRPDEDPAYLQRVHLDSGGYALDGTYWGIGEPLYCLFDSNMSYMCYVRAHSRKEAYDKLLDEWYLINLRKKL